MGVLSGTWCASALRVMDSLCKEGSRVHPRPFEFVPLCDFAKPVWLMTHWRHFRSGPGRRPGRSPGQWPPAPQLPEDPRHGRKGCRERYLWAESVSSKNSEGVREKRGPEHGCSEAP